MTLIADAKRRLTLGTLVRPGQVFDLEETGPGEFQLRRLERAGGPRLSLAELYAPVTGAGFRPGRLRREAARSITLA